ncbi:MAG: arylesterase, partial [Pseudomonadota bacterium]
LQGPGNFGPDYKEAFEGMYPDLAAEHNTLLFSDFLQGLNERPDRAETLRKFMQSDGIHPNGDGVALIVEAMGPTVAELLARAGS